MRATPMVEALVKRLESLEYTTARRLIELVPRAPAELLERITLELDDNQLEPEVRVLLALKRLISGDDGLVSSSLQDARARMRRDARVYSGAPVAVGAVRDLSFDGPRGRLCARHYAPQGASSGPPRALLVFFHGGGFVLGDLDTHDAPCRALCRELDAHVLSIEYGLAPEQPFPAGIEDARAGLRFAQTHAHELGADPARIGVAGDSAGANLATVVSQLAVRSGEPAPAMQLLIYPAVDSSKDWPSIDLFADGFLLTRSDVHWFRKHYFGSFTDLTDPRASPLLAPDLSGLPKTVIVTAGFDPLRDEGEAYAAALSRAGVTTKLRREAALIHGFINLGAISPAAKAALSRVAQVAREFL